MRERGKKWEAKKISLSFFLNVEQEKFHQASEWQYSVVIEILTLFFLHRTIFFTCIGDLWAKQILLIFLVFLFLLAFVVTGKNLDFFSISLFCTISLPLYVSSPIILSRLILYVFWPPWFFTLQNFFALFYISILNASQRHM